MRCDSPSPRPRALPGCIILSSLVAGSRAAAHARTLSRTTAARAYDDLREAVTTLEETTRIMRRVLGGAHPSTARIEEDLRNAQAALRAREETQPPGDA